MSPTRVLTAFICSMWVVRVSFHLADGDVVALIVTSITLVAALSIPICLPLLPRSGRRSVVLVTVQALLNYLPLLVTPEDWRAGASAFVAASVLLVVGGPLAWALFALIAIFEGVIAALLGLAPFYIYFAIVVPINLGLALYGLSHLADLLRRVRLERQEVAAKAEEVERLRLRHHVHALLGTSLSTVERLVEQTCGHADREVARKEISWAVAIARMALDSVRRLPAADGAAHVPPSVAHDSRIVHLATPILVLVHALFIGQAMANFAADATDRHVGDIAWFALVPVTFGLQAWHLLAMRMGLRPRGWAWTLTVQALTIYAPVIVGDASGINVSGFFGGLVLLYFAAPVSWLLCAVICGIAGGHAWLAWGPTAGVYWFASMLTSALAVYGLARLARLVTELKRTQAELIQMAVLQERLRVGRDVHDFLSRGLVTIILNGELVLRLLDAEPVRANEQVIRMRDTARDMLVEMAWLSGSAQHLALTAELASARRALESAGADVRITHAPVPEPVGAVLAVVVREAVTNVLKHSTPVECHIDVTVKDGRARLRVANDGATRRGLPRTITRTPGAGLENLRVRLAAVGGDLTSVKRRDRFELVAEASVDHENLTSTR